MIKMLEVKFVVFEDKSTNLFNHLLHTYRMSIYSSKRIFVLRHPAKHETSLSEHYVHSFSNNAPFEVVVAHHPFERSEISFYSVCVCIIEND